MARSGALRDTFVAPASGALRVLRQAEAQLDFPMLGAPLGRERHAGPLKPINSV
jgi:hypothetical protein